ncbi:MAG: aminoglycoside adenylyltransferase domain-containing protein [Bacillota bacterium]
MKIPDLGRYGFAPADLPIVEKLQRAGAAPACGEQRRRSGIREEQASPSLPAGDGGLDFRWPDVPGAVRSQVARFVDAVTSTLAGNLLGIYLHGSLATGGFNPQRSDIDLLVVTGAAVMAETKRCLVEMLLDLSGRPRPIEVSFLREADLIPWKHPTPYALHFSESWRNRYEDELRSGTWVRWNEGARDDADLAAHITVARHRGIHLAGTPVREALPPVPWQHYLDSIVADLRWAWEQAQRDPVYLTLNACRVLAAVAEGQVLSKTEAGVWALGLLPEALRPVVRWALGEYRGAPAGSISPAEIEALFHHVMATASAWSNWPAAGLLDSGALR